jgi:electron transfer flavoprotein alpha subunit
MYGAEKVVNVSNDALQTFNAKQYASVVNQVAGAENANVIIVDSSIDGLYLAPLVAVGLEAGYASNVVALPTSTTPFTVKRKAFSNKAFSNTVIASEKR